MADKHKRELKRRDAKRQRRRDSFRAQLRLSLFRSQRRAEQLARPTIIAVPAQTSPMMVGMGSSGFNLVRFATEPVGSGVTNDPLPVTSTISPANPDSFRSMWGIKHAT